MLHMKSIRVILADDHTLVRAGIRQLLEKLPHVQVVAEAGEGHEAISLTKTHAPDVVVMDIGMPSLNGLDATLRLRKECPAVRVVLLTMHNNEEYVLHALRSGAMGFVLKQAAVQELEAALLAVMRGETYVSSAVRQRVAERKKEKTATSPLQLLTHRQREILQLIAECKSTKEIADLLAVSSKTVEFHRAELMNRLSIHDVPGLVRYAIQNRLVPTESLLPPPL